MHDKCFSRFKAVSVALAAFMLLAPMPLMFADNTTPKLSKIPEVKVDKKKPGEPKDKLPNVTMCPGKWGRLEVVFKYQADEEIQPIPEDSDVANTSYKWSGAEFGDRSYVIIQSGANDGEAPVTTTVTVKAKHVQLGGKAKPSAKSKDFAVMKDDYGSFTVTVLPGKKPPCGQPKTATGNGGKAVNDPGKKDHKIDGGKVVELPPLDGGKTPTTQEKPNPEDKDKKKDKPVDKQELKTIGEDASFEDNHVKLVTEVGLTDAQIELPEGVLTVHFPEDMAVGDEITGSIDKTAKGENPEEVTTNEAALGKYTVEVETTKTFVDDRQFSLKIPSEAANLLATWLLIKDQEGQVVRRVKVPVHPEVVQEGMETATAAVKPEQFTFPRTCETGKPIQFKGPFQKGLTDTAVKIDGQEARILAKSPRSLVVENTSKTPGLKDVQLTSGGIQVRGPIESRLPGADAMIADTACQELMAAYKAELYGLVDKGWKPTRPPSHGVWTTVLDYNLTRNQTVESVKVLKSSGYTPLDQSAISRVYQLQGTFKPLPACYTQPSLEVEHTFKVVYK